MSPETMIQTLKETDPVGRLGRTTKILSTSIEADGPAAPLGALCDVETIGGEGRIVAEIVGVRSDAVVLAPMAGAGRTYLGAKVKVLPRAAGVPVGDAFLGRAVNALGEPMDGRNLTPNATAPLEPPGTSPLDRATPDTVLETGVRAIDGILTLGQGQRVGVFAPSGAGKTSLMTQLANQVEADRIVICLVGERGREVESMWTDGRGEAVKSKATLVSATSDQPAALRVRACWYALALANYWREQGHSVLLLLDSVTRLAMAMREIGLAAGEPPTVRAYTPSVFSEIPKFVEGCGALRGGGAITAIMTVLCETEDVDDPVSELMKSLLDGHIILSRDLAGRGHFPAIDVPASISRLAGRLNQGSPGALAEKATSALSTYESSRVLIESGVYVAGANSELDDAIGLRPKLMAFLKQSQSERSDLKTTRQSLGKVVGEVAS